MDWLHVLMPVSGALIFWPGLVVLGFGVGMIGGFFGMGGGWMVTPGLNILGFPMAFAIGTDIAQMSGPSLVSTLRHGKFGNVDYKLGLTMVIGTVGGLEVGARMIMWLERIGQIDLYVRSAYLVLLTLIAWLVFANVTKKRKKEREALASGRKLDALATGIEWHKTLHKIKIPPVVHFKRAGVRCSIWLPIAVSFFTGWLAGVLGIGGGLVRMPALIYLIGCPTHIAVGTDLFEIVISGLYGTASYSYKGRTELLAALIMLIGASIGAQIGSIATKYVKGYGIRIFFGFAVVGCGVSIVLKIAAAARPQPQACSGQLCGGADSRVGFRLVAVHPDKVRYWRSRRTRAAETALSSRVTREQGMTLTNKLRKDSHSSRFWEGHDFSRAVNSLKMCCASAPEASSLRRQLVVPRPAENRWSRSQPWRFCASPRDAPILARWSRGEPSLLTSKMVWSH